MGQCCDKAAPAPRGARPLVEEMQKDAAAAPKGVDASPTRSAAGGMRTVPCAVASAEQPEFRAITLYDQVLGRVDAFADKPAFVEQTGEAERVITFGELRARVRALAKGFLARGVKKGDIVAIYSANCIDWVAVAHAAMLAGVTVAPINPTYETRELMHHLTEATEGEQRVKMIFTLPMEPFKERATEAAKQYAEENGLAEPVPIAYFFTGCCDELIADGAEVSEEELEKAKAAIDPKADVALLPSSSGTTGPPKCVELTHFSLAANVQQCDGVLGYGPGDCTVAFLPFFHMFGLTVFVSFAVMSGMKTVIMAKFVPAEYLALIGKHKPTVLHVVPPVANALGKMAPEGSLDCVKAVLSAAAPLTAAQEVALQRKLPNGVVHQAYGMTELSPVSHFAAVTSDEQIAKARARTGTVGTPVAGTECRLVPVPDEPDATRGLLQIRGPQVMKGYRGRPEQTTATILDGGWLDTGDVAQVDEEGFFWIVDRVKELIKVKGFQVAPAELEGLLMMHDAVRECCVIGVPHERAGEAPKAFVSLKPGAEMTAEALHAALDAHLGQLGTSEFKRLSGGVEVVAEVQKTASGKLLRKEYRALEKQRREGGGEAPAAEQCFVPAK